MNSRFLANTILIVLFADVCFAQRDRGVITGIITDASGAVVPNAQVTAKQRETNSVIRSAATEAGAYTIPNLPIGVYTIEVEAAGFKKLERADVRVEMAQVLRVNLAMEIGKVTESIKVTAELSQIETETPRVQTTMAHAQVRNIPRTFTESDRGRTVEGWIYSILPGVSGSPQTSIINGINSSATKLTLFDGTPGGAQAGGIITESSPSQEAVGEFQVLTAGYTAEYGRLAQGVLSYSFKSGTNEIHGSAYGAIKNEFLNANTFVNNFFGRKKDPDRKYNYAFSFGGPIYIPKIYNGKNKTFFYATYERFNQNLFSQGAPNNAYPLQDFWDGDFSRLIKDSGTKRVGADALGRDIIQGTIYDPTTLLLLADGRYVANPFLGNVIPKARFSQVSQNVGKVGVPRYLPTYKDPVTGLFPLQQNANWPALRDSGVAQISKFDQYQYVLKLDHIISDKHKLSGGYDYNLRPVLEPRSGGLWDYKDPDGGPWAQNFYQRMHTYRGRISEDWTITPRVFNRFSAFYNLNVNPPGDKNTGTDGAAIYGIKGVALNNYPRLDWGAGPIYPLQSPQPFFAWVAKATIWGFNDSVSFSKGRHFFKAGYETQNYFQTGPVYDKGNSGLTLGFSSAATSIPNVAINSQFTGYSFASFLLGIVNNGSLGVPAPRTPHYGYHGLYFQDDLKILPNLTLNLGVRYDYNPLSYESHDRQTSWNPNVTDPYLGLNLKGAFTFAGNCATCTGSRTYGKKDLNNFAPRIGFAWQVRKELTVRGAYTVQFIGDDVNLGPDIVGAGNFDLAADPNTPWRGILNWDSGIPASRYIAPVRNVSFADTVGAATMVDPRYGTTPYLQQWNLNIQKMLPGNILLDVGYIGNKGTKLRGGLNRPNQTPASVITQYGATLPNAINNAADAARYNVRYPYPGFVGTVNSALREFPQLRANSTVGVTSAPEGMSSYNSLNVTVNRRMSQGLSVYGNWVWAKSMNNTDGGGLDYYNRGIEKGLANFDVPHRLKTYFQYELPLGRNKLLGRKMPKVLDWAVGGWEVSGVLNYFSGTPLTFGGIAGIPGWNGGTPRPNIKEGQIQYTPDKGAFDYGSRLAKPATNKYFDTTMVSAPSPLTLGTAAIRRSNFRGWGVRNEDLGLKKFFRFNEKYVAQLRGDFLNALNRKTLANPDTSLTSPTFGYIIGAPFGNRTIQIGARLDF